MVDIRMIKAPSTCTLDIIQSRSKYDFGDKKPAAIGLVQGKIIEMICAADIAQKCVGVEVMDVRGSCPQNMVLIAITGDTSSVEEALEEIRRKLV